MESIFPASVAKKSEKQELFRYDRRNSYRPLIKIPSPKVFIPVFPGTNCEYDTARAFEKAGGIPDMMVFRNLSPREIKESIQELANRIKEAQILMIPGGLSGGGEPDGAGKLIAAIFLNPIVSDAVFDLLRNRDGLILGIGDGFHALLKLGLVPYGEIRDAGADSPALVINTIGRHVSRMVQTRVASVLSPWLALSNPGDIHTIPVSHKEGRLTADLS